MKYINRKTRQYIIDTPIHKSTTKTETKDGTIKSNTKYIAHIPNEILIFLLERFKPFNVARYTDAEYIDAMVKNKTKNGTKYYLSFYNHPGKDCVELNITDEKYMKNDIISVTVKKQVKSNSYFFTVSKKVFDELKDDGNSISNFRFVLDLDSDSYYFKNFMVNVELV